MIKDVSLRQLFPTEYIRVVTELDHAAIAQHTIDFCKSIGKYTTYHSKEDSAEWAKHPEIQKLIQDIKPVSYTQIPIPPKHKCKKTLYPYN